MRVLFLLISSFAIAQGSFTDGVGWGANVTGGRGGSVVNVTNLNESGAGSLRQAILDHNAGTGATTITFNGLSGYITLTDDIEITRGDLTIAGQTSPIGITIRRANTSNDHPAFRIAGDNIIISSLKIRLGPHSSTSFSEGDAFSVTDGDGMYFRNISASWTTDETFGFFPSGSDVVENVTLHNIIVGEPLAYNDTFDTDGTYQADRDSRAILFGPGCTQVSMYNIYITSSGDRNPVITGPLSGSPTEYEIDGLLLKNIGAFGTKFGDDPIGIKVNIRNYIFENRFNFLDRRPIVSPNGKNSIATDNSSIYSDYFLLDDNFGVFEAGTSALPASNITDQFFPFPMANFPKRSRNEIANEVIENAGAFPRDQVDATYLSYINRPLNMKLIRMDEFSETYVSIPNIFPGYTDNDGDGISADYEALIGTSDTLASNNNDHNSDGITDLEEFLQTLLVPELTDSDDSGKREEILID